MAERFLPLSLRLFLGGICVLGCAWPPSLLAQSAAANTGAALSSPGEDISLDMVVRDKHGRLIRDLRPEEVKITDAGEPVSLRSLQFAASRSEGPLRRNRTLHAIVLLFDTLDGPSARFAREAALDLVKGSAEANALISVLCVGSRLGVLQPFTADAGVLRKAAETATVSEQQRYETVLRVENGLRGSAPGRQAGDAATVDQVLLDALTAAQRAARDEQARPAVASLLGLERALVKIAGRKTLLYFTAGLSLSAAESNLFQSLVSEANRNGVSLYPVDCSQTSVRAATQAMQAVVAMAPRGSNTSGIAAPAATQASHPTGLTGPDLAPRGQFGSVTDAMPTNPQDTLRSLASATGGLFMAPSEDLRKQIRHVLEDQAGYYEAAYTTHAGAQDGQFRKVAVLVNRPGLVVQTRAGYFALPPAFTPSSVPSSTPVVAFELPLVKAIREKSGHFDPEIRLRALEMKPGVASVTGELVAEIPLSHFQVQESGSEKIARLHFSILAFIIDETGKEVAKCSQDVHWSIASESKDSALAELFTFARPFTVPAGKYRVAAGVHDHFADKIYLDQAEFDFRPAKAPALSDAILVRGFDQAPGPADAGDPMLIQDRRIVPDLSVVVPGDRDRALPMFLVLYPDPASQEKPRLAVRILGPGAPGKETPVTLPETGGASAIPHVLDIPTYGLPAGNYSVKAIFTQGAARVEREAHFSVSGERAAAGSSAPPAIQRVVVSRPAGVEPLSEARQTAILAGARKRALAYNASLPNFTCIETVRRTALKPGSAEWKPRDTLSEMVRYIDGQEERRVVELNGTPANADRSSLRGTLSSGELGSLLKAVFGERPNAQFTWKETVLLDGVRCEVFSFHVERKNSPYRVGTQDGQYEIYVPYSGTVFLEAATFNVRRLTLEAVEIPPEFPVRASTIAFDYSYVRVGDSDFLLPVSGLVEMQQGKKERTRNEIQFRDYHRLGSQIRIQFHTGG